ncbi:MAG TPA: cysteine desulfurase NifS [Clostridiales bacterium]|nr:cysteine desulfurase NifS [Clostridiales bacterium]
MRQVYLDYAATTPVKEEVLAEMLPFFSLQYGNPSSLHKFGYTAREAVDLARERVAALIGAKASEIYFTSGGTESDNWAVEGVAGAQPAGRAHVITSKIEHHALLHSCAALEEKGHSVSYLEVDPTGFVQPHALKQAINERTCLVSIMFANNEVGSIQPIAELAKIANSAGIIFHTDAVQAAGNLPINVQQLGIDMLSLSAHKIYGPKGIGALYIKEGTAISNFIHGGSQEHKRRAGTENVPGIVGFGKAAELAARNLNDHIKKTTTLRDYFIDRLLADIPDVQINGSREQRLPGNVNATFNYIEGEALLLDLDINGIAASTGSACSSGSFAPSHVLTAMGLPIEQVYSSLRFSLGDFTTKEDIDHTVSVLNATVKRLRAFSPFTQE